MLAPVISRRSDGQANVLLYDAVVLTVGPWRDIVPVASRGLSAAPYDVPVIFKRVGDGRPYPDHGLGARDWAALPPRTIRLDELITTKDTLQLAALLDEDSTFFGDLFAHVVQWRGELYLEDGLHRALRAALQQRQVLHARVHPVTDGGKA